MLVIMMVLLGFGKSWTISRAGVGSAKKLGCRRGMRGMRKSTMRTWRRILTVGGMVDTVRLAWLRTGSEGTRRPTLAGRVFAFSHA